MSNFRNIHRFLFRFGLYRKLISYTQRISLPGFQGESVFSVGKFFFTQLANEDLNMRSASLAFNFFLALFPAIIFLFTLIPYFPISDATDEIMSFLKTIMPQSAFLAVESTIKDILKRKHGSLLSVGIILALYFSTNGFSSLMDAFNKYSNTEETRSWWRQRIIAIKLAIIISSLIFAGVTMITLGETAVRLIQKHHIVKSNIFILNTLRWVCILGLFFTIISTLFYMAPSKKA